MNLKAQDWMEVLTTQCTKAFPKIRIRQNNIKCSAASKLIDKRNILLKTKHVESKEVIELTEKIASILEEEGRSKTIK